MRIDNFSFVMICIYAVFFENKEYEKGKERFESITKAIFYKLKILKK